MTRVRFPLPAPFVMSEYVGVHRSLFGFYELEAHIAQAVEHFLGKEEVIGSNPIVSTK